MSYIEYGGFPPFAYPSGNGVAGSLPDFLRFVFEPLGFEIKTRQVDQSRVLPEVLAGRGEIMIAYSYPGLTLGDYPEGLRICTVPIYAEPFAFFSLSDKALSIKSLEDIESLTIGIVRVLEFRRGFSKQYKLERVFRYKDAEKMFQGLMAGRIDAALSGQYLMDFFARKNHLSPPRASPLSLGVLNAYIALSAAADSQFQLLETACERLRKINATDILLEMSSRHEQKLLGDAPEIHQADSPPPVY